MAEKSVYDLIKKQNGERFAKAIRNHDNGIFDIPDIVNIVKYAGHDAEPIIPYLISLKSIVIKDIVNPGDPFKMLHNAGYKAEYADTLKKQNAIQPYFARNEELCTFRDPSRYKGYYIVNVVHRDADKLKRVDFKNPQREDKYGTSVMSIQILKTGGFISIKNRYNHTVENPDNTYDSNPDNIVPGLSAALKNYFNVDFASQRVSLPANYVLINNQIIKYNYEYYNTYYGSDFWVRDGIVHEIDKRNTVMMDCGILDLKQKIFAFPGRSVRNLFYDIFLKMINDHKISISKTPAGAMRISINDEHGTWVDVRDGCVVGVNMPGMTEVPNNFLSNNRYVHDVYFPNARVIGNDVLHDNLSLENIDISAVEEIGAYSLSNLGTVREIVSDKLKKVGAGVFESAEATIRAVFSNLTDVSSFFFAFAPNMKYFSVPNVRAMGNRCVGSMEALEFIDVSSLEEAGDHFMKYVGLAEFSSDKIKKLGGQAFSSSKLQKLSLSELEEATFMFASECEQLVSLYAPKIKKLGERALHLTSKLESVDLSSLEYADKDFMDTTGLKEFSAPSLRELGDHAFCCSDIQNIYLEGLVVAGVGLGYDCPKLKKAYLPNLIRIKGYDQYSGAFSSATMLEELFAPKCVDVGEGALTWCRKLRKVTLDSLEIADSDFMRGSRIPELYLPNVTSFMNGAFALAHIRRLIAPALKQCESTDKVMNSAHIGYVRFDSLPRDQVPKSIKYTYVLSVARDKLNDIMQQGVKAIDFENLAGRS